MWTKAIFTKGVNWTRVRTWLRCWEYCITPASDIGPTRQLLGGESDPVQATQPCWIRPSVGQSPTSGGKHRPPRIGSGRSGDSCRTNQQHHGHGTMGWTCSAGDGSVSGHWCCSVPGAGWTRNEGRRLCAESGETSGNGWWSACVTIELHENPEMRPTSCNKHSVQKRMHPQYELCV